MLKPGDLVVYRLTKHSTHPSRRAIDIQPSPHGEFYTYEVLKYWVVVSVANGRLEVLTRRGKHRQIELVDPCLRKAYWWERLFLTQRFPAWQSLPGSVSPKHRLQAAG
jgi:hypothetical protein